MAIPEYDPKDGYCTTISYSLKESLIDVRLDGKPVGISATWCAKHDRWIGACSYEWYLKAKGLLGEGKCRCPNYLSVVDGKCGACGLPVPGGKE